jgi:hypothetical protein
LAKIFDLRMSPDWMKQIDSDEVNESAFVRQTVFDVRSKQGVWEKQNAALQRKLVREFDSWSKQTRDILNERVASGATQAELERTVRKAMSGLEIRMNMSLNSSLDRIAKNPSGIIEGLISTKKTESALAVRQTLIPGITTKLVEGIRKGIIDFKPLFATARYQPASYAGIHWVALFEVQKGMGLAREIERLRARLPIEPVRWVLDPNAQHCQDSALRYGCPGLAKEYPSWGDLPTVPAGNTTCYGNCRCIIEVKVGKRWMRGVPAAP